MTWLEEQTGERLDPPPAPPPAGRHLSIRVPAGLLDELEALAQEQATLRRRNRGEVRGRPAPIDDVLGDSFVVEP